MESEAALSIFVMANSNPGETMTNGNVSPDVAVAMSSSSGSHLVNGPTSTSPVRSNMSSSTRLPNATGHSSTSSEYTSIAKFYTDRSVFITGGTGFMGKVLVEKLLRSCPGIKNIYLLIRPKKGQETAARLNDLLNTPVNRQLIFYLMTLA